MSWHAYNGEQLAPGEWAWGYECWCVWVNVGDGPRPIRLRDPPRPWQWDGNFRLPTLTPSIRAWGDDGTEVWHGHLTKGELVPVDGFRAFGSSSAHRSMSGR